MNISNWVRRMVSLDDRRAIIAGDALCEILGILPLANIIIEYSMHAEAELVFNILMSSEYPLCFEIGCVDDEFDSEWCWINKNPPTKDIADEYGIYNWVPEDQYTFSIGFGNSYEVYDTIIPVTINDLLPSQGLNIANVPEYERRILDACREQYILKMGAAVSKLKSEE